MLAIRMQRVGRKGHAMYRLVVQESQRHPSSGRVIAYVGNYDPHTKDGKVQVELAQKYLDNGAQPSPRVVKLLKNAGVKLPEWVKEAGNDSKKSTRNLEKVRKNRPAPEEVKEEVKVETVEPEAEVSEDPVEPVEAEEVVEEAATTEEASEEPKE